MVGAITNVLMATASDRAAIAHLIATALRLTTELATVNVKLIVDLQTNCSIRVGRGGRNRTSRGQGTGAGSGTGTGSDAPARTGFGAPSMSE